jgi:hypothetical protein
MADLALRKAFRRSLLQHLAEHGARTRDELVLDPPAIMHLSLLEPEVEAAVDLSRRRGEIELVGANGHGAGKEWGLSDLGRPHGRRPTALAVAKASPVLAAIIALVGLAGALDVHISLKGVTWEKWVAVGMTVLLVAEILLLLLWDYRYGISRRAIADRWARYQVERTHGFAFYRRRRWMLIFSVAGVSLFVLLVALPLPDGVVLPLAVVLLIAIAALQVWFGSAFYRAKREWEKKFKVS